MATKKSASHIAGQAVEEQLARYRSMRDFTQTAEPSGGAKSKAETGGKAKAGVLPFVIQKHAASHLHYDFRLGWNGVLKSWAVAKGPSYVTKDKRLAVQVEDHPIEYGGFEGIIPKGQYGGGTVMLWDEGTWEPQQGHTDVDSGLRDGSLKFILHGTKMKGKWALIRMGGKAANLAKPNWLLIKEHDEFERAEGDVAITEEASNSVVTNRSLEEIAAHQDHTWNSKDSARPSVAMSKKAVAATQETAPELPSRPRPKQPSISITQPAFNLQNFPQESLPEFISPQLALPSERAPEAAGWLHELKFDGYRIQASKDGDIVRLRTRTGLDWTHRMKNIASDIARLTIQSAVFDGEVVVLAENGTTSFADLQAAFQDGAKHLLTYFVFDLLHLNGHNLRPLPLLERKKMLANALQGKGSQGAGDSIRISEHIEGSGYAMFRGACELHAEGIISKRASAAYRSGRSGDWLKIKCKHEQEFVIGGFTVPSNGAHGIGALLLGYYDERQQLVYAGRTGTGFTQQSHRLLRNRLDTLKTKTSSFDRVPPQAKRGVTWVKPLLVAQVNFATWTSDRVVRQAAFKGLREDKPATDVHLEEPASKVSTPDIAAAHKSVRAIAAKTIAPDAKQQSKAEHPPVRLTHPDKIIDVESGITKQQLADYYWAVSEYMLPEIANRPLSLVRCPEGSEKPCFFQKHTNSMLPKDIETVQIADKKTGEMEPYITLSTREALAGLAQMGVLELHPWGCRNEDLEHPDRVIIDLDPDASIAWETLAESANEVRALFKKLGLESFLKSTGGKGLHIMVPILPQHDWSTIKNFAHSIALHLERTQPSLYLTKMSKAARKGRIFVDYLRNERGATAVAAYSPRARAGMPVSVPLEWKELNGPERPIFHVADFDDWKGRLTRSPWKNLPLQRQAIGNEPLD